MKKNLVENVFKTAAVVMGIAVFVLNTLGVLSLTTAITLLGLGLVVLADGSLPK